MVDVAKIWEDTRKEGLNYGLPTVFLNLGNGPTYTSEDLVREILMHTRCKWVCILGENTTQVGMGTLVKGLSSIGMFIEVEASGEVRDPGWLHTVDRWVIDYAKEASFNYGALRSQDMIRFVVKGEGDLNFAKDGLEEVKIIPGTKYIRLEEKSLRDEAFALVRGYEKARLYA